jgi:hypothetical protein
MTNAVSRAARERMARTGEPYALARRMVIMERERQDAQSAEAGTPEPFFAFTDEHGEFLRRLFGPTAGQPSSGPPYTHVHRLPEAEEEMAAAPLLPSLTITKDGL